MSSLRISSLIFGAAGIACLVLVSSAPSGQGDDLLLEQHRHVPFAARFVNGVDPDVDVADFDQDGSPDIVVHEGVLTLSFGSPDAFFTAADLPLADDQIVKEAEPIDADGDGDPELAIVAGGSLLLLQHDGARQFSLLVPVAPALPMGQPAGASSDMIATDLSGDGDLDLVYCVGSGQDGIVLLENDGTGLGFQDVSALLPVGFDDAFSVVAGDLDSDGDIDLVLGGKTYGGATLLRSGPGPYTQGPWRYTGLPPIKSLALADYDGDGALDLLVGVNTLTLGSDLLLLGDGQGDFSTAPVQPTPARIGIDSLDVAFLDLEADGDLDLALARIYSFGGGPDQLALFRNDGPGVLTDVTGSAGPLDLHLFAFGAADFDGDLDIDLACARPAQATELLLNDGAGTLARVYEDTPGITRFLGGSKTVSAITPGDFDGDGDADVVVSVDSFTTFFWLNDGDGRFVDATDRIDVTGQTLDSSTIDLERDGDLDLLTASFTALQVNDGNANLTLDFTRLVGAPLAAPSLAVGDLDGDGWEDCFFGASSVDASESLYNDGAGSLVVDSAGLPPSTSYQGALELGDLDGDGDLDLFFAGSGLGVWRNEGLRTFTDISGNLPVGVSTGFIALGDLEGDGDLDVFVAPKTLLLNDGNASFSDVSDRIPFDASSGGRGVLVDLDADGGLDLATTETVSDLIAFTHSLHVARNDGSGSFTELDESFVAGTRLGLAAFDFDGDGDVDIFQGDRLFANRTAQLAWRALPRIGRDLDLEVHATTAGPFLLAISTAVSEVTLPPFGVLRIDPASIVDLQTGSLTGSGIETIRYAIPADPSLIGFNYYGQALVGAPLRLTNRETATITGL